MADGNLDSLLVITAEGARASNRPREQLRYFAPTGLGALFDNFPVAGTDPNRIGPTG